MSFFLNGCQIIEKNASMDSDGGGFEVTEGFDGADFKAPEVTTEAEASDDVPF